MTDIFGGGPDNKAKRTARKPAIPNEELPSGALLGSSPSEQSAQTDAAERAERIGEEALMISDHASRNAEQARIANEYLSKKAELAFGVNAPVGGAKQADRLREVIERYLPTYRRGPCRFEDLRAILLAVADAL